MCSSACLCDAHAEALRQHVELVDGDRDVGLLGGIEDAVSEQPVLPDHGVQVVAEQGPLLSMPPRRRARVDGLERRADGPNARELRHDVVEELRNVVDEEGPLRPWRRDGMAAYGRDEARDNLVASLDE